jgi:iron complex outermembrane receptor protein
MAQQTLIVKDLETNKPLAGATVLRVNDSTTLISSKDGAVDLTGIAPGTIMRIMFLGYKTNSVALDSGENIVYLEPDYQLLNDLIVVGYHNDRKLAELAGSYAIVTKKSMDRFNDESLVRAMNTMPGIRLEERSPGSYRVSIRGNLLRAPYGVRNVKVYWNDIPYTDPTGSTPLNLLDLNNIDQVEVIKGPAGSIYGAGMGGMINLRSLPASPQSLTGNLGFTSGSYSYAKVNGNINSGDEGYRVSLGFARQKGAGYRDQTNFDRQVIQMSTALFVSDKRTLRAQILYSDLYYQTPGGLTEAQYDEDPRQARPGAAAQNSSIDHQNFLAGLVQDYEWNGKLKNTTAIYFSNGIKENPFINNYELEKLKSFGGRTVFNIRTTLADLPTIVTTGTELNYGDFHASNHGNVGGYADTLRYEDELKSLQTFAFLQADVGLADSWFLNLGGSLNFLNYDIHRLKDVALDTSYQVERTFSPEFIPRLGIVGRLLENLSVHGSVSVGFSPPTTDEVRTSDGGINKDLEAEKGINYEIGLRGNIFRTKLYYDLSGFWLEQRETIVSKTTASGSVIFENAGSTTQAGLEALLGYNFISSTNRFITLLNIQTAYTYHNFTFKDYVKRKGSDNIDYSGNALTGTAPNIVVASLDINTKNGLYFYFTYNFTDRIPLNDANTVFADSYQLITIKTGWDIKIKTNQFVDVFMGVDNLLNEKYSLGNDLNAFGARYFNPSPERNYYAGIKYKFK